MFPRPAQISISVFNTYKRGHYNNAFINLQSDLNIVYLKEYALTMKEITLII